MNKDSKYEDITNLIGFYFANQERINKYARIVNNSALNQKDTLRKRVYRWEESFCYQAKLLPLKKNFKTHSLEYCTKYLNQILNKEFYKLWKLNPNEAQETLYYNRHTRLLPKFTCNEILPYWEKGFSTQFSAVGKTYRKKGEHKFIIVDKKIFKKTQKIKGPINNKKLKDYVDSKLLDEEEDRWFSLCDFHKAVMWGKDKIKIYYTPYYAVVTIPPNMRREKVMLHELAHLLSHEWEAHHSSTFVTILAYLYHKYLNVDYRLIYETAYLMGVSFNEKHSFFLGEKVTSKKMIKYVFDTSGVKLNSWN